MLEHYQVTGATAGEISASVEAGIRAGDLVPGQRLPAVRTLAERLGVSPATVAAGYRLLRDRGVVSTAGRAGTTVRRVPPVSTRTATRPAVPNGLCDLASGLPCRDLLPDLTAAFGRVARSNDRAEYPNPRMLPRLRELAAARLGADGVAVSNLTVTSGALDGIERVLATWLRPGDRVGVEDPCWPSLLDLVAALGLVAVPMTIDNSGPTPDGLGQVLASGAVAVVVTARAQNPTGALVAADRAARLRQVLARYPETLLIEDDHAAELADSGLSSLTGVTGRWAFLRSLSKPYGADLRIALLAADEATCSRVEGRMALGAGWVSTVLQALAVELLLDPRVAATVGDAAAVYARRRDALVGALAERGIQASGASGINIWVPVPDETVAATALRDLGYAVAPGAMFRLLSPPAVRITAAGALDDLAVAARLADALAGCHGGHRRSQPFV